MKKHIALTLPLMAIAAISSAQTSVGTGVRGGRFQVDAVLTGQGTQKNITSRGTSTISLPSPSCGVGISGVATSANSLATGKYTVTVTWIPSFPNEQAPDYAYLLLNTVGRYSNNPTASGTIDLGLPELPAGSGADPHWQVKTGQKVLKLKLTNGVGQYVVNGGVSVTATSSLQSGNNATVNGSWIAVNSLDLKAIGFADQGTNHFTTQSVGAKDKWIIERYGSDDFERQVASVGTVKDEMLVGEISGYIFSHRISMDALGQWNESPDVHLSLNAGDAEIRHDPATPGYIYVGKFFSLKKGLSMRTSPEIVTVNATTSDPTHPVSGPFNAKIEYEIWAPDRLLEDIGDFSEVTQGPVVQSSRPGGPGVELIQDLVKVGQTGAFTYYIENDSSIDTTVGITVDTGLDVAFLSLGVAADFGVTVGQNVNVGLGGSPNIGPCENPVEKWELYKKETHTNHRRFQGQLDPDTGAVIMGAEYDTNVKPIQIEIYAKLIGAGMPQP